MTFELIMQILLVILTIAGISTVLAVKHLLDIMTKRQKTSAKYDDIAVQAQVDATNQLLVLIDSIINNEVREFLRPKLTTMKPYNMLNLDKDVDDISHRVFDAIKKDVFTSNQILVSDEYLFTVVTKETMIKLIETGRELNAQIAATKNNQ